ncbi:MAG: hypothetical protein KAS32_27130, partial [Candidatus Peribacteraceae bacterium]|nr:hypothetical protein [Candidatus Peribacteraceae bacterium]
MIKLRAEIEGSDPIEIPIGDVRNYVKMHPHATEHTNDRVCRPFFDYDQKAKPGEKFDRDVIIKTYIKCYTAIELAYEHMEILGLDSSDETKISFHFTIPELSFKDSSYVVTPPGIAWDEGIYMKRGQIGVTRSLRLPEATRNKDGRSRTLIPVDEFCDPIEISDEDYRGYLITNVENCEPFELMEEYRHKTDVNTIKFENTEILRDDEMFIEDVGQSDDDVLNELAELLESVHPGCDKLRISDYGGGYNIKAQGTYLDECRICHRCHTGNEVFIFYDPTKRKAFYNCFSSKQDGEKKGILVFGMKSEKRVYSGFDDYETFDFSDGFGWIDFVKKYGDRTWESYEVMDLEIGPQLKRCYALIVSGHCTAIKKSDIDTKPFDLIKATIQPGDPIF